MKVPDGWTIRSISELTKSINSGISRPFVESNVGVPVLRSNNVRWGQINLDQVKYWYSPDPRGADLRTVSPTSGDVLVNFVNGSRSELGKAALYQAELAPCIVSTNLFIVRFDPTCITPQFANAFFQSVEYRRALSRVVGFSGPGSFNKQQLGDIEVLVPPLPEQRKIAEILGTWDEAIRLTADLIAAKQQRKKGLMQRLLTGEVRFAGFEGRQNGRFLDDKPVPSGWAVIELDGFVQRINRMVDPKKLSEPKICIELEHIAQVTGKIIGHTTTEKQLSNKVIFEAGQVLFGKLRPYLRKYAQPDFDGACSSEIWVLSGQPELCHNDYLYYLVQSERFIGATNVTSGSKMPRADWNYMAAAVFALPNSLEEQAKIAALLKACDHEIDLLQQKLAALRQQKKGLMQRLLTGTVRVKV